MVLTPIILNALKAKVESLGDYGATKLATEIGTSKANVCRWLKYDFSKKRTITESIWQKLEPSIRNFLPLDFQPCYYVDNLYDGNKNMPLQSINIDNLQVGRYVFNGIISVNGISIEKVIHAIASSSLSKKQKQELCELIFSK